MTPIPRSRPTDPDAVPPAMATADPGAVIKIESLPPDSVQGSLFRVMYHSRSVADEDIAVTGSIAVPNTPAPIGGRPVVTIGHGGSFRRTGRRGGRAGRRRSSGPVPG